MSCRKFILTTCNISTFIHSYIHTYIHTYHLFKYTYIHIFIGGVDQRLHYGGVRKGVSYAKMFNAGGSGWFGVNILDIKFVLQQGQVRTQQQW